VSDPQSIDWDGVASTWEEIGAAARVS
jgi:hypothetical protein